ncbi:MAG: hypothetical protein Q4D61_09175 [Cardiobacteriaceae bacterium]|nr:hypothetical protein [Cardiobacteriaceae bacterium]
MIKKTALAWFALPLAHAATDDPATAFTTFADAVRHGEHGKVAQSLYLAPALLAQVDRAALLADIEQCLTRHAARIRAQVPVAKGVDAPPRDGRVILHTDIRGQPMPIVLWQTAHGWQPDMLQGLLALCPDIGVGDPAAAARAILQAYAAGDDAALAARVYLEPRQHIDIPWDHPAWRGQILADVQQAAAALRAQQMTLDLLPAHPVETAGTIAIVPIRVQIGGSAPFEDTMVLHKSARGWQMADWLQPRHMTTAENRQK